MRVRMIAVGVNRGPGGKPLKCAENDAREVHKLFTSVIGPVRREGDGRCLVGRRANAEGFIDALEAAGTYRPDYFILYFSGHGNSDGILLSDGLFQYDALILWIRAINAGHTLIIFDTCHAGAYRSLHLQTIKEKVAGVLDQAWLQALANAKPGTRMILSSGKDRTSGEGAFGSHGNFTYFLLEVLRTAMGDLLVDDSSFVSDQMAFSSVRIEMAAAGQKTLPVEYNVDGEFPLIRSQADAPPGIARIFRRRVLPSTLELSVWVIGRRGIGTRMSYELCNEAGVAIFDGVADIPCDDEVGRHVIRIACPHDHIIADQISRLSARYSGHATLEWNLRVEDDASNVLDEKVVAIEWRQAP